MFSSFGLLGRISKDVEIVQQWFNQSVSTNDKAARIARESFQNFVVGKMGEQGFRLFEDMYLLTDSNLTAKYCELNDDHLKPYVPNITNYARGFFESVIKTQYCVGESVALSVSTDSFSCSKIQIFFNGTKTSNDSISFKASKDAKDIKLQRRITDG